MANRLVIAISILVTLCAPIVAQSNNAMEEAYPGRTVLRGVACNKDNPCPYGYTCMHSASAPGAKSCYSNVPAGSNEKKTGRCPVAYSPVVSRASFEAKLCMFHVDCPVGERCCGQDGSGAFFGLTRCVRAEEIPDGPNVIVLVEGQSRQVRGAPNMQYSFTGTVALVQSDGKNILFDTGNSYSGPKLLAALAENGLTLDDVDMVVTSHGHPDHYSNNGYFPDTENHFSGFIVQGDSYEANPLMQQPARQEYLFNDRNLEMINTPGHTPQDTSLVVRNVPGRGTVILCGDTVLSESDLRSQNGNQQPLANDLLQSRRNVVCDADYVVPGHGPMFAVGADLKGQFGCPQFG